MLDHWWVMYTHFDLKQEMTHVEFQEVSKVDCELEGPCLHPSVVVILSGSVVNPELMWFVFKWRAPSASWDYNYYDILLSIKLSIYFDFQMYRYYCAHHKQITPNLAHRYLSVHVLCACCNDTKSWCHPHPHPAN